MAKKILVADDDPEIVELLQFSLTSAGYTVVSVPDGFCLPALVKKEKPDLLILDVMLPGMDGYSLEVQFSHNEETRQMPVIVLTALPAARQLFEQFPQVKKFMSKPFESADVVAQVKEILGD